MNLSDCMETLRRDFQNLVISETDDFMEADSLQPRTLQLRNN